MSREFYCGENQIAALTAPAFGKRCLIDVAAAGRRHIFVRHFQNGALQLRRDGRAVACSARYVTVDPYDIKVKLELEGFKVTRCHWSGSGRRALMEARYPDAPDTRHSKPDGDYTDCVRFLLDHTGRKSILVAVGALRIACENQFLAPALTFSHVSPLARDFSQRPATVAWYARRSAHPVTTMNRLEGLRGVPGEHLFDWLRETHPKLFEAAYRASEEYFRLEGNQFTAWAVLQAMTATHKRSLIDLTGQALSDGYNEVADKTVPAGWLATG